MFYNVVVNDWGETVETTYVPTTAGNVLLVAILAILLVGAILFAKKYAAKQKRRNGRRRQKGRKADCQTVGILCHVPCAGHPFVGNQNY